MQFFLIANYIFSVIINSYLEEQIYVVYSVVDFYILFYFPRDFRLILTPKKGILHSNFKAYTVDGDGLEKPVFVGKYSVSSILILFKCACI